MFNSLSSDPGWAAGGAMIDARNAADRADAVTRRLDRLERALIAKGILTRSDIEDIYRSQP